MTSEESAILSELRVQVSEIRVEMKRLEGLHDVLLGDTQGNLGMLTMVKVMWKAFWIWPLCSVSALLGCVITLFVERAVRIF